MARQPAEAQKRYLRLNGKYLNEADQLLEKGDLPQASEKFWGAMAEVIKAVAAAKGRRLGRHKDLARFVQELHQERPEWKLNLLFAASEALHTNYFEDHYPKDLVGSYGEATKRFVGLLKQLI